MIIHIKQNEQLYLNFKEKYDSAVEVVKSIEDEKDKLKKKLRKKRNYFSNDNSPDNSVDYEESPRVITTSNYSTAFTNYGSKIPQLNFKNLYHSVNNKNHITLHNLNSNRSYNENLNCLTDRDLEKLKEDYLNLYEEKKQLETEVMEHLNCKKKIMMLEENFKETKSENDTTKTKLKKIIDENENLHERIAKLTKENSVLTETLKSTRESLNISEKERFNIKNKISVNLNKTKIYEKENFNAKKKIQNLNHQIKDLTKKLKEEADEKILLEKKVEDIIQEFENKIFVLENEKQKAIKDSLSTLIKQINEESCMEFLYNKENKKIEIYFEKEKIAEVENSEELQNCETENTQANPVESAYMKTENTVRKILSPLRSKKNNMSIYQNEDSKEIDQLALKKLFSQHTVSSAKSLIDTTNKENIFNNANINLMSSNVKKNNSNAKSFKAKRIMRKETMSSNKNMNYNINNNLNLNITSNNFNTYAPSEYKKVDGPNPFDFKNIENCIQRTNLNNSLRYVFSSSNHMRTRPMVSLNIALGEDKVNECDDLDVTCYIKKLNFYSTSYHCFEILGTKKEEEKLENKINPIQGDYRSSNLFEIKNFDINFLNQQKCLKEFNYTRLPETLKEEKEDNYHLNQNVGISDHLDKVEPTPRSHRSIFSYEYIN